MTDLFGTTWKKLRLNGVGLMTSPVLHRLVFTRTQKQTGSFPQYFPETLRSL